MTLLRNIRKGFMFLRGEARSAERDCALVERYLSSAESDLFRRMDEGDQVHSLRVAQLCLAAPARFPELDERVMMKAALLHDVGKVGADLTLGFRTLWVLGHRVAPWLLDWIARRSAGARPGSVRQKMYVQLHHAAIGAEMLREIGTEEEVCRLVAATGGPRKGRPESLALEVLWAADGDCVVMPGRARKRGS